MFEKNLTKSGQKISKLSRFERKQLQVYNLALENQAKIHQKTKPKNSNQEIKIIKNYFCQINKSGFSISVKMGICKSNDYT